jgi:RNA polymerase sigma-70 factor (ECF subfamily)
LHSRPAAPRIVLLMEAIALQEQEISQAVIGEVLSRAMEGDAEAFGLLVRQHQRMVFSVVWNFFSDRSLSEDVAQDVFLQLFQNIRAIESDSHLLFWLRRVAIRKCIDHHRWRLKRKPISLDDWIEEGGPVETPDILALGKMRTLVVALPAKFRAVVVLRYLEDQTPEEMAETLGWPLNTVKSRLHRALKMLKERMEKQ